MTNTNFINGLFEEYKDNPDPIIQEIIMEYAMAWMEVWEPGIEGKSTRFINACKRLQTLGQK